MRVRFPRDRNARGDHSAFGVAAQHRPSPMTRAPCAGIFIFRSRVTTVRRAIHVEPCANRVRGKSLLRACNAHARKLFGPGAEVAIDDPGKRFVRVPRGENVRLISRRTNTILSSRFDDGAYGRTPRSDKSRRTAVHGFAYSSPAGALQLRR